VLAELVGEVSEARDHLRRDPRHVAERHHDGLGVLHRGDAAAQRSRLA
jgi:hypothetical protein